MSQFEHVLKHIRCRRPKKTDSIMIKCYKPYCTYHELFRYSNDGRVLNVVISFGNSEIQILVLLHNVAILNQSCYFARGVCGNCDLFNMATIYNHRTVIYNS